MGKALQDAEMKIQDMDFEGMMKEKIFDDKRKKPLCADSPYSPGRSLI